MGARTVEGATTGLTSGDRSAAGAAVLTVPAALVLTLLVTVGLLLGASAAAPAASAQETTTPTSTDTPYGGALDLPDPGDVASDDQVLEVGMLVVGTVNGLLFAGAMVLSRLRGSSHAATRRALIARTGAGTVSEAGRRPRRARPRAGARVPVARA